MITVPGNHLVIFLNALNDHVANFKESLELVDPGCCDDCKLEWESGKVLLDEAATLLVTYDEFFKIFNW